MRGARAALALLLLAALPLACPESRPPSADTVRVAAPRALETEGVVCEARSAPPVSSQALPDRALLEIDVRGPDGSALETTRLSFHAVEDGTPAARPTKVASREERLSLPPGTWDVHVEYRPAPSALGEGWVRGLVLEAGANARLAIRVELRTGELAVRVRNQGRPLDEDASYRVHRLAARGAAPETPVAEGRTSGRHVLPYGRYQVTARATWSDALAASATSGVLDLGEAQDRITVDLDLATPFGRLLASASVGGRSVDDDTSFVVFPAGTAAKEGAEPLLRGWGGDALVLREGSYDVFVRYRAGPLLSASRWLRSVSVPGDGSTVPLEAPLELRGGRLRFRVLRNGVPVRDGLRAKIFPAGADPETSPLGELPLEGPLHLPPGRYDIELVHRPQGAAREPRTHRERGVVVEQDRETLREIRL